MSRDWKARRQASYPRPEMSNPRPACREGGWRLAGRRLGSGWMLLLYWVALATATHWPGRFEAGPPVCGLHRDHIIHAIIYMPLVWLLNGFIAQRPADCFGRRNRLWISAVVAASWGVFDEWSQAFFGRGTSYTGDWIGDLAGVLIACVVVLIVRRLRRPKTANASTSA